MSCTKMNFALRLLEAYHQVIRLLFERCLQPFFDQENVRKDLTGSDEFMASVAHAVEVNKDKIVDMQTFQFLYKLTRVATQLKNFSLAPSKGILPLSHAYWNRVKPGSDINTQMLWDSNFITPVHGPQCALVKQIGLLQTVYAIHRLGQILRCGADDLESFSSAMAYRKHLGRDQALWKTTRSVEANLVAMTWRHGPARPIPMALSLIHISEPTRPERSRMPSSA